MLFHGLPDKKYRTITIDPPWRISLTGRYDRHTSAVALPYETLTVEEIKTFPLTSLAETGCHVYLWTTNRFLRDAFDVLEAWGVSFHLAMPMVKKSGIAPCNGYVFGSEFCLLGFAGRPMLPFCSIGKLNWLLTNPRAGKHSAKPDSFYSLVETMSPGPYLDCFARRHREKWDCWGDQLPKAAEMKAA